MTLQVELVSAERRVWSGEATSIIARTTEGELGVLTGHAPLLALLQPGTVRIGSAGGPDLLAEVGPGFLSVEHDRVTLVTETASLATSGERR